MFRTTGRLTLLLLALALASLCSCSHRYYVPEEIPIRPGLILNPDFEVVPEVQIINDQSSQRKQFIGIYSHRWTANFNMWTKIAVDLIKSELAKKDVTFPADAPKSLKLAVTDAHLDWEFRNIGCSVILYAETGEGYGAEYPALNYSPDLYGSCDLAITQSVAGMLNDPAIREYLAPLETVDHGDDFVDTDGDGVPDVRDECPDTPRGVAVDERGCPPDTDGDGVPDYRDECPDTPRGAKVDARGCWDIPNVLFEFDKFNVRPQFFELLDEIARVVGINPGIRLHLDGHADDRGTNAYNLGLSERRAKAVKRYLVGKGIAADDMTTERFGSSQPVAAGQTETARTLNRRVVIRLIR